MSQKLLEPVKILFQPDPQQIPFFNERYNYRYRLISGGTGSGKTIAGCYEDLYWCIKYPGIRGAIFEPTYRMIKDILIPTFQNKWLFNSLIDNSPLVSNFNKSDMIIDFTNESQFLLRSLDHPESAEGINLDFAHVDEPRLIPHFGDSWSSVQRRLRGSRSGEFPIGAWLTTTPDYPGSDLYKFFIDPKLRTLSSQVYTLTVFGNTHTSNEYKQDIIRGHTGNLADRFIFGKFAPVGVGSFNFDQRIHMLDNIDLNIIRSYVCGCDFGWTNETAVLVLGIDGDGRVYILDEFYRKQTSDEDLVEVCREFNTTYNRNLDYFCDPTNPQAIYKLNDKGINALPNKAQRLDGLRDIGGRLQVAGDGKPRLYILSKCVNTMSELMGFSEDKKERDHTIDSLRYALIGAYSGGEPELAYGGIR